LLGGSRGIIRRRGGLPGDATRPLPPARPRRPLRPHERFPGLKGLGVFVRGFKGDNPPPGGPSRRRDEAPTPGKGPDTLRPHGRSQGSRVLGVKGRGFLLGGSRGIIRRRGGLPGDATRPLPPAKAPDTPRPHESVQASQGKHRGLGLVNLRALPETDKGLSPSKHSKKNALHRQAMDC